MLVHERERRAADERTAVKLLDVIDEVNATRNLVDAAWMAAHGLPVEQQRAMAGLLALISERLSAVATSLLPSDQENADAA